MRPQRHRFSTGASALRARILRVVLAGVLARLAPKRCADFEPIIAQKRAIRTAKMCAARAKLSNFAVRTKRAHQSLCYTKALGNRMAIVGKHDLGYSAESQVSQITRIYSTPRFVYTVASCGTKWGNRPEFGRGGGASALTARRNTQSIWDIQPIAARRNHSEEQRNNRQRRCWHHQNSLPSAWEHTDKASCGKSVNRKTACFLASSVTHSIANRV